MLNHSISPNGHQTLKKETDQPIIHFFCTYTPEEILMAADLQPHRVIPFHFDPSLANTFLDSNFCPYVRSILVWAMEINRNHEISPTVILNSCDGMRRLYDVWKYYINSPFTYFLDLPRKRGLLYEEQFKLQLYCLKEKLEGYTGKKITDKKLHFAIQQVNEFRKMIQQLDQMRQQKMINLSNYEFFRLVQNGSQYSKVVYNDYLRNYLHHCIQHRTEKRQRKNKKSFKILITGTILDNLEMIKMIEQYGGFVEVADTCNGWRYYFNTIDENEGDMMGAIAHFYLNKIACPRMLESQEREEKLVEMIRKKKIDGMIFYTLKFCDTSLFQLPLLREKMKLIGIPSLYLEGDFSRNVGGQLRTRIQAFMEALEFA